MARTAIIPPPGQASVLLSPDGVLMHGLFSSPMIDEMEGYDHDQCNNRISKEGCKGISTSSVDADV
jgi:hypothetical protein